MGTHIFNIPTVISHSSFKDSNNKTIHISEKEINYFYSLLYLYRKNLIFANRKENIFIKSNKKENIINPSFNKFKVKIDLIEFNTLGITGSNTYKDLEKFLLNLYYTKIEINIFGKNRDIKSEIIDMIQSISIDNKNTLHIEFTDVFATMVLHTKKYFMDVDLDILFSISGYKSKRLYLIFTDYCNLPNKTISFTRDELKEIIINIPQKSSFNDLIENINITTKDKIKSDIKIIKQEDTYYQEVGSKKSKDLQFEFENLRKSKKQSTKASINNEVMSLANKKLEKEKSKGNPIKDEEAYINKIYLTEMDKLKPKEKTKNDMKLEFFINESVAILKLDKEINYNKFNYLMLSVGNNDYFIQDDYTLLDRFKTKNITNNSTETLKFINDNNIDIDIFTAQGNGIRNCQIGLIQGN